MMIVMMMMRMWRIIMPNSSHQGASCSKTNDLESSRFVKISNVNISELPIFFVGKKCEKLSFFSTKNISVFGYKVVKRLTS